MANPGTGVWAVTQRYVYSPYVTITVLSADWSTPPMGTQPLVDDLYQGMTLDAVTGLYYERFRNYSPSLGTLISQDPAQYINGASTYQFVMSNPAGNLDPSGRQEVFGGGDFGGEIGGETGAAGDGAQVGDSAGDGGTSSDTGITQGAPNAGSALDQWNALEPEQRNALNKWMGTGVKGAENAGDPPPGLTRDTIEKYGNVIRSNLARGAKDNGVMRERLKVVDRALSQMPSGPPAAVGPNKCGFWTRVGNWLHNLFSFPSSNRVYVPGPGGSPGHWVEET